MSTETDQLRFRGPKMVESTPVNPPSYTSHPEFIEQEDEYLFLDANKLAENKTSNEEANKSGSSEGIALVVLLTALSFFTRLYKIGFAPKVIWDEAHFGKFGSYYIENYFYHDVHPPLGKMLVGLAEYISGANGTFKYESGQSYPQELDYTFQRSFLALFGIIMVPLAYGTARNLGMSRKAAFLAGIMVLFDNALCVISRFILLDSMVLGFTSMSFYFATGFHNQQKNSFTPTWWFWLCSTGLSLGLASSVKWVGFFAVALVGLYTVEDLYAKFGDAKMPKVEYAMHWVARIFGLIVIPLIVYASAFYLHFSFLTNSGDGDSNMPSLFQAGLKGSGVGRGPIELAYGSKFTLKSYSIGGGLLHSHKDLYPEGSKQHQVTTYSHTDTNNDWVFLRDHSTSKERKAKRDALNMSNTTEAEAASSVQDTKEAEELKVDDASQDTKPMVNFEKDGEKLKVDKSDNPKADEKIFKAPRLRRRGNEEELSPPKEAEEDSTVAKLPGEPQTDPAVEGEDVKPKVDGEEAPKKVDDEAKPEGAKDDPEPEKEGAKLEKENAKVDEEAKPPKPQYVNDYTDEDEDLEEEVQYIKDGDVLRLNHIMTAANLHSHTVEAPMSKSEYEVSGYLSRQLGDVNDHWKIEIYDDLMGYKDGKIRILSSRIRLRHVAIGCYLATTSQSLPGWGFGQGEVVCRRGADFSESTLWNVEAHWNARLPEPTGETTLKSPFYKNFIHLNAAMWRTNNALTPDEDKLDALTSQPYHWPLMLKGIRMCGWGDEDIKFYMLGNPLVWWSSTLGLILISSSLLFYHIRHKRKFREWYQSDWEHYVYTSKMILLGWFLQYVPYYIMGRVMYVHHYFPALYFSTFAIPFLMDHYLKRSSPQVQLIAFSAITIAITVVFIYFSPMTFGMDFPSSQFKSRNWVSSWRLADP